MKEKSWVCTLITQLSLCAAAFIALNLGQPQKLTHGRKPIDVYFISVAGGFRPLEQQTLLLKQMVKVKKIYNARFVVDMSEELGESEPLLQNATTFPELRKMPWYTCGAMRGQGETYFLTTIEFPLKQTLDIIALDTVLFQDPSSARGNDQILWLKRTLNESDSDWKIVVGFNSLISCDHNISKTEEEVHFESLHTTLLHYGADAYMSTRNCDGHVKGGGIDKGPYITAFNQNSISKEETVNGFLLHRVSHLEMVTFAVKLTGEVEHKLSFQQRGRSSM